MSKKQTFERLLELVLNLRDRVAKLETEVYKRTEVQEVSKANSSSVVEIYTDGSCKGRVGGWAYIMKLGKDVIENSGRETNTTNNRMELLAALNGLKYLSDGNRVKVYSDAKYLVNGMTTWMSSWKKSGWRSTNGPVKNKDLWLQLDRETARLKVEWVWVRGHNGNEMNERADRLATKAMEGMV